MKRLTDEQLGGPVLGIEKIISEHSCKCIMRLAEGYDCMGNLLLEEKDAANAGKFFCKYGDCIIDAVNLKPNRKDLAKIVYGYRGPAMHLRASVNLKMLQNYTIWQ